MPHDKNGAELKVGDRVTVECEVMSVYEGDTACNLSIQVVEPAHGGGDYKPSITLNAGQVVRCDGSQPPPMPGG